MKSFSMRHTRSGKTGQARRIGMDLCTKSVRLWRMHSTNSSDGGGHTNASGNRRMPSRISCSFMREYPSNSPARDGRFK